MKQLLFVIVCWSISGLYLYAEESVTEKKVLMHTFQEDTGISKYRGDSKTEEEEKLEEDGFCPCLVQRP